MDLELRLAALSNLVPVKSDEIERKLLSELNRVEGILQNGTDYDDLAGALKILTVLAPRFSFRVLPMLREFVRSVPGRALTWSGEPIQTSRRKYRSASQLIRDAIDVPQSIRYVHLNAFLDFLLELWDSEDKDVSGKADRALESLASFDLNLFFGERGLGARPQEEIVAYFARMLDKPLFDRATIVLKMLGKALSPSIEGHTWTHNAVKISRGGIPAGGGVAEMRAAAIKLLKRLYLLNENVHYRKRVLDTLNTAARREGLSSDADTSAMFERDAMDLLNFLRDQVPYEELQLVQAIEHDAYWNYYHAASTQIAMAALEVRDAIDNRPDYLIYKDLIGFEGIHGAWEDLKRSETAWDYSDDKRREATERYLLAINDETSTEWCDRILEFSKTRSDDMAMFPIYYDFLKSVGQKQPQLALELLKHEDRMRPFLIALLRGLWSSERQDDAEAIANQWINDRKKLSVLAKSLNVDEHPRLDLLARVMDEADRVNDQEGVDAITEAMGVAAQQYGLGIVEAKSVFLKGIRLVAKRQNARWANVIWLNRDFRKLVEAMEPAERSEVLASMVPLTKVDYQAEEVLSAIGKHDPQAVLDFLMDRVREERAREERRRDTEEVDEEHFEAIPYNLHKLSKLLTAIPRAMLRAVRGEFKPENSSIFSYHGGTRLIKAVFPEFEQPLRDELLTFIKTGKPTDIDFVVAILRAYSGSVPILETCKEIVKIVPERSSTWNELAAVFGTTGVVSGEYGILCAYEAKREEITHWKDDENSRVRAFAIWLTDYLDQMIVSERQRADEGLALRKHRYGADVDEG